jgi:uncharacterized coiled-coil DUF342 family protein
MRNCIKELLQESAKIQTWSDLRNSSVLSRIWDELDDVRFTCRLEAAKSSNLELYIDALSPRADADPKFKKKLDDAFSDIMVFRKKIDEHDEELEALMTEAARLKGIKEAIPEKTTVQCYRLNDGSLTESFEEAVADMERQEANS